ncbi:carbohydrate ABC transporter permease [Paeniglutamicibacter psychrophenolicus]|uniref:carbohydrate ABC transporter permease n=1 Tax=Paeniglutamicibacter psychrophenolicus TaxID=257454 RepID=UPI002785C1F7|nr:sugar ABC transporter permease [Paeniglutamicibacter psychrophenolicus]MDQ0094045.1 raffinose/stachyose/melibiose transport system permease protein [Paeniglutamicibacter psychrophenolicus]
MGAPRLATGPSKNKLRSETVNRTFYWMVIPALLLFVVLHTIPALTGIFYSFTNYAGYGEWDFVGIGNYVNLFRDDRILSSYGFTFLFATTTTIVVNVGALFIALLLNAKIKFQTAFRGIFFIPNVLSVLIVGYVFNYLLSNNLPLVGQALGIEWLSSSVLTNPDLAWLGIVGVTAWQSIAFSVIIYLAGLQTVPAELYEAASIDGATHWRKFTSITFPMISAFFTINMVLALKGLLQAFDQIVALTGGGPGTSTESVAMVIYRGGFQGGEYGYQMANSVVYLIVIVVLSLLQMRTLQRKEADFS